MSQSEHSPPPVPGFRILASVASGASGTVYRAVQEALEREVALKILAPGLFDVAETRSRFRREARILAGLTHPNLLRLFDAGFVGDRPYLVTEFVEGGTLRELVESEGALPLDQVRRFGLAIAGALAATHQAGVVHRDLKPDNVLLTRAREVKLADFGLAKTQSAGGTVQTAAGVILGTPGYMAPEIIRGEPATVASDVYALGAILFEMIAGQRAFDGRDLGEILQAHLEGRPPDLSASRSDLPDGVQALVAKCLDSSPPVRPAAGEVERRLGQLLANYQTESGEAPRSSVSRRSRSAVPADRTRRQTSITPVVARGLEATFRGGAPPARGRRRLVLAAALVAWVLAGSVFVVWLLSPRMPSTGGARPTARSDPSRPASAPPATVLTRPRVSVGSDSVHLWFDRELPGAVFNRHLTRSPQVTQTTIPARCRDLLVEGLEPGAEYRGWLEFAGARVQVDFGTLPRLASSGCTRLSTARCQDLALHADGPHAAVAWSRITGKWASVIEFRESFDGGRTWGATEQVVGKVPETSPSLICQPAGLHLGWTMCCPAEVRSLYRSSPGSDWTTIVHLSLTALEPPCWLERSPDGRIALLTGDLVAGRPVTRILFFPERPSGPDQVVEPVAGVPLEGPFRLYPMGGRLLALGGGSNGLRGCLLPSRSASPSWRVLVPPGPQGGSSRLKYSDLVMTPEGMLIAHEQVPSLFFYRLAPDLASCVKVGELDGASSDSVALVRPALVRAGKTLYLVCNGRGLAANSLRVYRSDGAGSWLPQRSRSLPPILEVSNIRATLSGDCLLTALECASDDGVAVAAMPLGPEGGSLLGGGIPAPRPSGVDRLGFGSRPPE